MIAGIATALENFSDEASALLAKLPKDNSTWVDCFFPEKESNMPLIDYLMLKTFDENKECLKVITTINKTGSLSTVSNNKQSDQLIVKIEKIIEIVDTVPDDKEKYNILITIKKFMLIITCELNNNTNGCFTCKHANDLLKILYEDFNKQLSEIDTQKVIQLLCDSSLYLYSGKKITHITNKVTEKIQKIMFTIYGLHIVYVIIAITLYFHNALTAVIKSILSIIVKLLKLIHSDDLIKIIDNVKTTDQVADTVLNCIVAIIFVIMVIYFLCCYGNSLENFFKKIDRTFSLKITNLINKINANDKKHLRASPNIIDCANLINNKKVPLAVRLKMYKDNICSNIENMFDIKILFPKTII